MVVTKREQEKFQTLMRGTIVSLCQNVLEHKSELKIEVFFGITLDKKQDFHFSLIETLSAVTVSGSTEVSKPEYKVAEQPHGFQQQACLSPSQSQTKSQGSKPQSASNHRSPSGSMLERLMTQDLANISRGPDHYKGSREVSPSPKYKGREVSSSTATDSIQNSSSLSYSELLRSFGEMSRQDGNMGQFNPPAPNSQAANCPTLYNSLTSNTRHPDNMNSSSGNQPQVVLPINFALHSPTQNLGNTPGSSRGNFNAGSRWDESPSPRAKKPRHKEKKTAHKEEDIPPDSTYPAGTESYGIKVKQEIMSDEEGDHQEDNMEYNTQYPMVPPPARGLGLNTQDLGNKNNSPCLSNDSSASSQGILMSLLCEKLPDLKKKQGRAKKRVPPVDPPYSPPKSCLTATRKDQPNLRDNRVLIGLTDYLPGFKDGDLNQEKPPKLVFSAHDIIAKTQKVVLLNSGSFSTVRMVHRSLQGMKAYEIGQIMENMSRPRGHPEYVGEYKVVNMVKVRQGRKTVGVFYKCPPEFISVEALRKFDIKMEDYNKFYSHVFRYDRVPQPQYFEAIIEASPFTDLYDSSTSYWRSEELYDKDPRYIASRESVFDISKDAGYGLGQDDMRPEPSGSQGHHREPDSDTDVTHSGDLGLRITTVKTEQADWDSVPQHESAAMHSMAPSRPEYPEMETDAPEDLSVGPVTSTQRSWSDEDSLGQRDLTAPFLEREFPVEDQGGSMSPNINEQMNKDANEYDKVYRDDQSSAICSQPVFPRPMDKDYDEPSGVCNQPVFPEPLDNDPASTVCSQPVFPQPLMVEEKHPPDHDVDDLV